MADSSGTQKLEASLDRLRQHSAAGMKAMHAQMLRDVRAARKRANQAERAARRAERRADRLEAELAAIRQSATWRAGRAVVAVPAAGKRLLRRGGRSAG